MGNSHKLRVELGNRSYDIVVERGIIGRAGEYIGPLTGGKRIHIVSDSNLASLYAGSLADLLRQTQSRVSCSVFPAGEQYKTLATASGLLGEMIAAGLDRESRIVALGGGVTGDMAGFAAAVYMRGINFIQIPSSLLAMVDSSVGGKTGVDLPEGKNLVGAFWQPELVLIDPELLRTLPAREIHCGWAEIIKYGVIADPELFKIIEENTAAMTGVDLAFYSEIICRCCGIKAGVVAGDERESGRRAILNYGHTFGHAIEAVSGFRVGHGEGVSIGMCMAADLAVKTGAMSAGDAARQEALLARLGMPVRAPGFSPEAVVKAMAGDKKKRDGRLVFILPRRIGEVCVESGIETSLVLETVRGRCD